MTLLQGAHWNISGRKIHVAANPHPTPEPIALVKKPEWIHQKPNPDVATAHRCVDMLKSAGFDAVADPKFNWLIDTFPMLIRMFPNGMPPITIISQNSFFEPHFHIEIGKVLRPLREEGYLFIGSGGGVHNLYRTEWKYNYKWRDNFAQDRPPLATHLEFRQALEDVICKNGGGPELKRGIVRLMKHPNYRDAHGTDDHYMPTCFVAGIVGEEEDRGDKAVLGAEVWELVCFAISINLVEPQLTLAMQRNQCETQFCIGDWPEQAGA